MTIISKNLFSSSYHTQSMVAGIFGISVLVTGCDSSNSPAQSASENTTSE